MALYHRSFCPSVVTKSSHVWRVIKSIDSHTDFPRLRPAVDWKRKIIALVVPNLTGGGGVPAVARFVKDTILRDGRYELRLVSLSTHAADACSLRIAAPSSWFHGVRTTTGTWEGLPFTHVGALVGEFEFQRYRPRAALSEVLADCDLIQVVCGSPAWANTVLGLGKPVALQVATRARVERRQRDANPRWPSDWWRKAMTQVSDRLDDRALRGVDAIQVENPWMLAYTRSMNKDRAVDLRYAPPGVDVQTFRPLLERSLVSEPYILCVARLDDPRKNIELLLESYALLPAKLRAGASLVLAGSSAPPEKFWRRATELGLTDRITFVERPDQNALVRLYQDASVFALPSDEEGLGVVVLEAMACGLPVVATRSGGPDGIITDGDDGYLVPLDNARCMALRIGSLLHDAEVNLAMGVKARQTIERRYSNSITGEVFIDMWDRFLGKGEGVACAD